MESPVIVHTKPQSIPHKRRPEGFFNDHDSLDADDQFDDPWKNITSRHPELASSLGNIRPWGTWGARKRRGSAAGNDRPTAGDTSDDSRERYPRDSFFDDFPEGFRGHIPSRWSQHFEPETHPSYSQTLPRQERSTDTNTETPHTLSNKSTQTPVEEIVRPNLTQHGLRNTVDLGQKTAAESDQLDAETARNARSMSAPPGRRFSSPQRPNQMGNPGNPPPAPPTESKPAVRVIPIFVEGRDEPVINETPETVVNNNEEPRHYQEEFFSNHNAPHGFQPPFGRQSPFGFNRKFGHDPFQQPSMFKKNSQPRQDEDLHQNFKEQTPPKHVPQQEQFVPQQQNVPPPQQFVPPQPQVNDPITKIQLIQKDVLELMTRLENFSGTSKKDKEYIYLDEMLTRNLLKLDDIDTEGKESIRSARKEAIKCIEKCIAVLEAKAEANKKSECASISNGQSADKMETNQSAAETCEGNVKVSDMDVDNVAGQQSSDASGQTDSNNAEMDVDRSSQ